MALSFTAGQLVTAAELNLLVPLYAVKVSSQTVTATTTLVNDNDITFTLSPFQTYEIQLNMGVSQVHGTTGEGVRTAWAVTGTPTVVARFGGGPLEVTNAAGNTNNTAVKIYQFNSFAAATMGATDAGAWVQERVVVSSGLSGGTITLQFAQSVAQAATSVTMLSGTYAVCRAVA